LFKSYYIKNLKNHWQYYLFLNKYQSNQYTLSFLFKVIKYTIFKLCYLHFNKFDISFSNFSFIKFIIFLKNIFLILIKTKIIGGNASGFILKRSYVVKFNNLYYSNKSIIIEKIIIFMNIFFFNIKWIFFAAILSGLYFFISLFYISIDFTQQIMIWFVLLVIYYLLISTFNNFLLKYKYGKFTSAIQRFWKRTGIIFWMLEGFLFALFFYYFLNSSQEQMYMFDYSSLNLELLISLKTSYYNLILISLTIYLSFILLLNNNFLNYKQNLILLILISLLIFYILYIESYQFVYVISLFTETEWTFDDEDFQWSLEIEMNTLRVKQQYFLICLIAKYWHFIFIFISWFFFLIKCIELNKISYTLLGYNVQNLIILYILNLMCLIQWLKFLIKKFSEISYYWFHLQYDEKLNFYFFEEIYNVVKSLFYFLNDIKFVINDMRILSTNLMYTNEINLWKYI